MSRGSVSLHCNSSTTPGTPQGTPAEPANSKSSELRCPNGDAPRHRQLRGRSSETRIAARHSMRSGLRSGQSLALAAASCGSSDGCSRPQGNRGNECGSRLLRRHSPCSDRHRAAYVCAQSLGRDGFRSKFSNPLPVAARTRDTDPSDRDASAVPLLTHAALTHHISGSWWWVLSPLWISVALIAVIVLVGLVVMAVKS